MREGTRRREGRSREGHAATPAGEGNNRRLWRRRCASLETCGGPEGGTRELLTGSLPGLCGAVRSERSFGLTVSRLWRPCCVRERQSRARSRDAAVRRSRAEGGPAATRVPSKRPPAPDPSPPAARPGATGSAAVRGEAPRSCFVPNGPVTWGRGASWVPGTQDQKYSRGEFVDEQIQTGKNLRREGLGAGRSQPSKHGDSRDVFAACRASRSAVPLRWADVSKVKGDGGRGDGLLPPS